MRHKVTTDPSPDAGRVARLCIPGAPHGRCRLRHGRPAPLGPASRARRRGSFVSFEAVRPAPPPLRRARRAMMCAPTPYRPFEPARESLRPSAGAPKEQVLP
ncbi:hypothetical protein GCM10018793_36200 [Streptomyces sulfonofaciens]|uniref:Uncharacterized protein n=1 Tax=Streptomyces sulfonofaciens TaxID=68272 RepID=A0A919GA36_9ACTN|nr:hypothetical protein GCM10018793_36200 [Streptomyces sulfonofaciens]